MKWFFVPVSLNSYEADLPHATVRVLTNFRHCVHDDAEGR